MVPSEAVGTHAGSVFVEPGPGLALHRPALSAPAPFTRKRLLSYCEQWAREVGWTLSPTAAAADAVVVGPGVDAAAGALRVLPGQGIDGFRWGIRHLAFTAQWPPETIAYGPSDEHVADVRRPEHRRGVAVVLHGGFWMDAWRRSLMDGVAVDLARRGFQTWNAEYRRVGSGGGWPQSGDDAVAVVDAACAGGAGARAVTVVGHSAGGQLALHAARRRPETVVRAVVLAGLSDLDEARRQGVGGGAVDRFLGQAPVDSASPVQQVPVRARVVLAHCVGDTIVPMDQSRRYAEAAAAAGGEVELLTPDDGDHMSLIEPENGWGEIAPRLFT